MVPGPPATGSFVNGNRDGLTRIAAASTTRSNWDETRGEQEPDIRRLVMQLLSAVMQAEQMGSPQARSEATRILNDARRQVYRLLAEDEGAAAEDSPDTV